MKICNRCGREIKDNEAYGVSYNTWLGFEAENSYFHIENCGGIEESNGHIRPN